MTIKKEIKYILSTETLSQDIDGELILLDMKSEKYFGLNEVGNLVLSTLKTGTDLDTLIDTLFDTYDVEKRVLETDITELLQELLNAGLIHAEE